VSYLFFIYNKIHVAIFCRGTCIAFEVMLLFLVLSMTTKGLWLHLGRDGRRASLTPMGRYTENTEIWKNRYRYRRRYL